LRSSIAAAPINPSAGRVMNAITTAMMPALLPLTGGARKTTGAQIPMDATQQTIANHAGEFSVSLDSTLAAAGKDGF
jgi:hypothetical protein